MAHKRVETALGSRPRLTSCDTHVFLGQASAQVARQESATWHAPSGGRIQPSLLSVVRCEGGSGGRGCRREDGFLSPPADLGGHAVHIVAEPPAGMPHDAHPVDHGGGCGGREGRGRLLIRVLSPAFYRSLKGTNGATYFENNMSADFPNYSSVLVHFYAFLYSEATVVYNLHMAVTRTWSRCHVIYLLLAFIFLVLFHTINKYKSNLSTVHFPLSCTFGVE